MAPGPRRQARTGQRQQRRDGDAGAGDGIGRQDVERRQRDGRDGVPEIDERRRRRRLQPVEPRRVVDARRARHALDAGGRDGQHGERPRRGQARPRASLEQPDGRAPPAPPGSPEPRALRPARRHTARAPPPAGRAGVLAAVRRYATSEARRKASASAYGIALIQATTSTLSGCRPKSSAAATAAPLRSAADACGRRVRQDDTRRGVHQQHADDMRRDVGRVKRARRSRPNPALDRRPRQPAEWLVVLHVGGGQRPPRDAGECERRVPENDRLIVPVEEGKASGGKVGPRHRGDHRGKRGEPGDHLSQLREPLPRRSEPRVELERAPELRDGRLAIAAAAPGPARGCRRTARCARRASAASRNACSAPGKSSAPPSTIPSAFQYDAVAGSSWMASRITRAASAWPSQVAVHLAQFDAHERVARRHLRHALVGASGQIAAASSGVRCRLRVR